MDTGESTNLEHDPSAHQFVPSQYVVSEQHYINLPKLFKKICIFNKV